MGVADLSKLIAEHRTLQEIVYDTLRQAALEGTFAPGSPLRQEALAEKLQVSSMPVREALRRLEAEGLVTFIARRGAIVKPLDPKEADDVFLVRTLLEPSAARLATPNLQPDHLATLRTICGRLYEAASANDREAFLKHDRAFHHSLYSAVDRPVLLSMIRQLWDRSEIYRAADVYRSTPKYHLQQSQAKHRAILRACIHGDGAEAERATRAGLDLSAAHLKSALQELFRGTQPLR